MTLDFGDPGSKGLVFSGAGVVKAPALRSYLGDSSKDSRNLLCRVLRTAHFPPFVSACPQPSLTMPADCFASLYSGLYSILATAFKFQCILSSVKIYIIVGCFVVVYLFVCFVYCCNYFNFQK